PNRLVRDRFDLGNDLLRAGRKIAVNDEHVIFENNPAVIAMSVSLDVAFVKINVVGDLPGFVHFRQSQTSGKTCGDDECEQPSGLGKFHGAILRKLLRRVKWEGELDNGVRVSAL